MQQEDSVSEHTAVLPQQLLWYRLHLYHRVGHEDQ